MDYNQDTGVTISSPSSETIFSAGDPSIDKVRVSVNPTSGSPEFDVRVGYYDNPDLEGSTAIDLMALPTTVTDKVQHEFDIVGPFFEVIIGVKSGSGTFNYQVRALYDGDE